MAKSVSGKKSGGKRSAGKAAKKARTKKASAKKVAKKAFKKTASKKKTAPRKSAAKKPGAKRSASKSAVTNKNAGKKSAAKKSPAKRVARKSSAKKSGVGKGPRGRGGASSAPAARKPLSMPLNARKTARSRLAKRASHEPVKPARKIALRTSLLRRPAVPGETLLSASGIPAAQKDFVPSALSFRPAVKGDWSVIRSLLVEAFGRVDESELVERLRASRELVAEYVAEYNGRPVAYVGFSALNVTIDGRPVRCAGLAPIAVAAEFEHQGVATRLIVFGFENVRGLGHMGAFVLGDPAFFSRFGFSAGLAARFTSPWPKPNYMAIEFEPGALRGGRGETVWPEAFSLL
jgi:putative acetyltransferase